MKTIVVASNNPVKSQATLRAFQRMFPEGEFSLNAISVPSGVKHQPFSDQETLQGASTRAQNARRFADQADYWVGIEGGVLDQDGEMSAFAWVVVLSQNRAGKSRTGMFYLPEEVARLVREGKELGIADDIVFGRSDSKQENGAIGLLTGDVIDRVGLYEHAIVLALVPFKNADLYPKISHRDDVNN
ncbi:MAG TPA: inosine/xanthosine triphosphatase [Anaerolineales bacterium]|jgi:inosine/xanthosine triphosphatase|nr:inosine/xanthosine triphosphatase [Anaerolineales bacterium]